MPSSPLAGGADLLVPVDGADALEEAVLDTALQAMDEQVVAESGGKQEIPFELVPPQGWDLGVAQEGRVPPPVLPTAIASACGP